MSYIQTLKDDHRQLLALAGEAQALLAGESPRAMPPPDHERLQMCLRQLIDLLQSHGRLEDAELFPALRRRLPEADHWQIKMVEIQDEAVLMLANDLQGWATGVSSFSPEWVQENAARLLRWLHEHVAIEEERLFPRLEAPPGP